VATATQGRWKTQKECGRDERKRTGGPKGRRRRRENKEGNIPFLFLLLLFDF
jgi:hypothetical protein